MAAKSMMTMIRYFGNTYGYILDFNITLAIDFKGLY